MSPKPFSSLRHIHLPCLLSHAPPHAMASGGISFHVQHALSADQTVRGANDGRAGHNSVPVQNHMRLHACCSFFLLAMWAAQSPCVYVVPLCGQMDDLGLPFLPLLVLCPGRVPRVLKVFTHGPQSSTPAPTTPAPTTQPATTQPDTTLPNTTPPDTTAPDTSAPDTTPPDTTPPDTTLPVRCSAVQQYQCLGLGRA